jgi:hypothetical protein
VGKAERSQAMHISAKGSESSSYKMFNFAEFSLSKLSHENLSRKSNNKLCIVFHWTYFNHLVGSSQGMSEGDLHWANVDIF